MKVVVIGAGSIGANIAYRLAHKGVDVTVLDAGQPAGGTSRTSISWLSSFPQIASSTPAMLAVRHRSTAEYKQLETEIGSEWIRWTGTVTWSEEPLVAERLRLEYLATIAMGHEVQAWTPGELSVKEPAASAGTAETVYFEPEGGWVDLPTLVPSLLYHAEKAGARVVTDALVTEVQTSEGSVGGVQIASGEVLAVDVIVNAAGSWSSHVSALAGCATPLDLRPGLVVYSPPLKTPLTRVVNSTEIYMRPHSNGGVAIHWRGESTYGRHDFNAPDPVSVLKAAARVIPELATVSPLTSRIGIRPVPPDGPIVGWHPSLQGFLVATSHGGVGFGPLWGSLVAEAVETGATPEALLPFSPRRFIREARAVTDTAAAPTVERQP